MNRNTGRDTRQIARYSHPEKNIRKTHTLWSHSYSNFLVNLLEHIAPIRSLQSIQLPLLDFVFARIETHVFPSALTMATKKHLVKLKLLLEFLKTLPVFAPPKPKRVKKVAAEDKKSSSTGPDGHKGSSPAPDDTPAPKINTGPKEMSTAGLTVNNINQALDKSGAPSKKWVRTTRQFKSFSGFKTKIKTWKQMPEAKREVKAEKRTLVDESDKASALIPAVGIPAN